MKELVRKFKAVNLFRKCATVFFVSLAVAVGGTKPNPPPGDDGNTSPAPRRAPRVASPAADGTPADALTEVAPWRLRGAHEDWVHVAFPDGFSFPYGLERLARVTVLSNGAIRSGLRNPVPIAALPASVSLEPGVSSFAHGLTASNSYLFAWHDVCVNRASTNRADAAIELFADGSILVTMDSLPIPVPPSPAPNYHTLLPPAVPAGFVGQGQDETWIRGNFALLQEMDASLTNVTQVLDAGYTNWLSGWVGIDAQNGRYQTAVTVPEVPAQPCYLVCGPFKVAVTAPGTYRFPFMVFTDFEIRTYPDALPHTVAYDDGYRGTLGQSWEFVPIEPAETNVTHGTIEPKLLLSEHTVLLSAARGKELTYWCNLPEWERELRAFAHDAKLRISSTQIEIHEADIEEYVLLELSWFDRIVYEHFSIEDVNEYFFSTNRVDSAIAYGPAIQTTTNDWGVITYFTISSESGSTNEVRQTTTVQIPAGHSCVVGAFMATVEFPDLRIPYCNDSVGWCVTASGCNAFSGTATVSGELDAVAEAHGPFKRQKGVSGCEHLLSSRRYDAPSDAPLTLNLEAWAANAQDGLRQTAMQLVVYPIDDDDNIVGWPTWASGGNTTGN